MWFMRSAARRWWALGLVAVLVVCVLGPGFESCVRFWTVCLVPVVLWLLGLQCWSRDLGPSRRIRGLRLIGMARDVGLVLHLGLGWWCLGGVYKVGMLVPSAVRHERDWRDLPRGLGSALPSYRSSSLTAFLPTLGPSVLVLLVYAWCWVCFGARVSMPPYWCVRRVHRVGCMLGGLGFMRWVCVLAVGFVAFRPFGLQCFGYWGLGGRIPPTLGAFSSAKLRACFVPSACGLRHRRVSASSDFGPKCGFWNRDVLASFGNSAPKSGAWALRPN